MKRIFLLALLILMLYFNACWLRGGATPHFTAYSYSIILYRYRYYAVKGTCAEQVRAPALYCTDKGEPAGCEGRAGAGAPPTWGRLPYRGMAARDRRPGIFDFPKIPRKPPKKQMAVTQKV